MANQVTFQIKIETLGAENVKNVTMDAEELGRVVKEVGEEQDKLNTKLLDINQAQQAIQNVTSGISALASDVQRYTSVYAMQETVERKVAQVMKNTMDASEAEIESIKKLCAAQQELGVIGDEVQMAGAQELATYLEKKSSLEKLIPVMNDMLAQQYGLEASQESAATIATMLGKVMDGQTQALSRYGYSFTEAQEQVLKFGTEEERAAVLAAVVEQSVGGMNAALAQTDSGKAKQMSNTIGDLKEQVGACLVKLEPFVSTIGEIGMGVQGVMSVTQGMRGLVTAVRTASTAMRAGAASAGALGVAIRGMMIATGVGAAIAALTWAISKLMEASDDASESMDVLRKAEESVAAAQDAGARAADEARIAIDNEKEELAELMSTNGDAATTIDRLNQKYGETFGYHQTAAEWYDVLTKKSEDYCQQLLLQAEAQDIVSRLGENSAQLRQNFREQERLRKEGKDKDKAFSLSHLGWIATDKPSEEMKKAQGAARELREEGKALREEYDHVKASLKEIGGGLAGGKPVVKVPGANAGGVVAGNPAVYPQGTGAGAEGMVAEGSYDWYVKRLQELRKQVQSEGSEAGAQYGQALYEQLEKEFQDYKVRVGIDKPKAEAAKSWMDVLREQLSAAQKELEDATTVAARVEASAKVDEIQSKINEQTQGKVTIQADVTPSYVEQGSLADQRQSYGNAQSRASRIRQDFEIGLIGKDSAVRGIAELNAELRQLNPNLKPLELEVRTKGAESAVKTLGKVYDGVKSTGNSIRSFTQTLRGHGTAWEKLTACIDALMQAYGALDPIIKMVSATSSAATATEVSNSAAKSSANTTEATTSTLAAAGNMFKAHSSIPIAGIALAAAAVAAMVAIMAGLPKFASGAVAFGPTLGLFGEYSNAATNPEVVAPLDKLRGMLGVDGGGRIEVTMRMRGRDLVGVGRKRSRLVERT